MTKEKTGGGLGEGGGVWWGCCDNKSEMGNRGGGGGREGKGWQGLETRGSTVREEQSSGF